MYNKEEAWNIFNEADLICSADFVLNTVHQMAGDIIARVGDSYPLVLSVMGGAVVFTGHLLPLLKFPLDFDYIHASRYGNETVGTELNWKVMPTEKVEGRTVLVLDDILDEGHTLAAIKEKIMALGARACYNAVLAEKDTGQKKPIEADFVGMKLPNRYVFGFGMDVKGMWRNLPAIYAVKNS